MGAEVAKPFVPLKQFSGLLEFIRTLKCVTANVMQEFDHLSLVPLSSEEREEFEVLQSNKRELLRETRTFVAFLAFRLNHLKNKAAQKTFTPDATEFDDLKYGLNREPIALVLTKYINSCTTLADKYHDFGRKLEEKNRMNERSKKVVGSILVLGGLLLVTGVMLGIAFKGGDWPEIIKCFQTGSLCFNLMVSGLSSGAAGTITLQPSEVEKATTYLQNMGKNLQKIEFGLSDLLAACEEDNHEVVMANFDFVLNITYQITQSIETALMARYK